MKRHPVSQVVILGFAAALLISPLALGSPGGAAEPVRPTNEPTVPQAPRQLLTTKFFAFEGVGIAGTISEGEKAFHAIATSTNALEILATVLSKGTTEAQLYALCGIRNLAPKQFEALAKPIVAANATVRTMSGCIVMEEPASNVVARIAAGSFDLSKWARPRRALERELAKQSQAAGPDSMPVYGGVVNVRPKF